MLGIKTSCDETAAAVVDGGRKILSSIVASQDDVHAPYGGVVPELASRQAPRGADAGGAPGAQDRRDPARRRGRPRGDLWPRAGGLAADRLLGSQGHRHAPGGLVGGEPPRRGTSTAFLEGDRPRVSIPGPRGLGRAHRALPGARGAPLRADRADRDDAAGGLDKVAKLLGLGFPGGPPSGASHAPAIRARSRSRPPT